MKIRPLAIVFAIARGIALDQRVRRRTMACLIAGALAMVAIGVFFLWGVFAENPVFFAVWWIGCGWLLLTAALLAIYDLLAVMRAGREERREARRGLFKDPG